MALRSAWIVTVACVAWLPSCGVDRDRKVVDDLAFVDGACPTPEEARPLIVERENVPTRIDGMSCSIQKPDDVGAIALQGSAPEQSCCLAVACSGALDGAARRALFDATCRRRAGSTANTCENLSAWTRLDPVEAGMALAAHVPGCTLAANAGVVNVTTIDCHYEVSVHLRCDDGPG